MMKSIFIFLFVVNMKKIAGVIAYGGILLSCVAVDGEKLIRNAIECSNEASYVAKVKIGEKGIGFLSRLNSSGQILKKLELESNNNKYIFIQNENGNFVTIDGVVFQVLWIPELSMWDELLLPLATREYGNASYEIDTISYEGEPCYQVIMTHSPELLASCQNPSRPAKRVFLIRHKDNIILQRIHYDSTGKKINSTSYQSIDYKKIPNEADFQVNGTISSTTFYTSLEAITDNAKLKLSLSQKAGVRKQSLGNFIARMFHVRQYHIISWIILGISIVSLLLFGILRWRKKNCG